MPLSQTELNEIERRINRAELAKTHVTLPWAMARALLEMAVLATQQQNDAATIKSLRDEVADLRRDLADEKRIAIHRLFVIGQAEKRIEQLQGVKV